MSEIIAKAEKPKNFIDNIIDEHNASGKYEGRVHTRFPPEPNGYLHIGHAKSICLNFGTAKKYDGNCNLRFDDTNPLREEVEFIEAIKEDVRWLGFTWHELCYASNYFDQLHEYAIRLIKKGKAYVDSQSEEEVRKSRGSLTEIGKNSPFRNRSVEENLDLFARMKNGECKEGEHILRAKIDMTSGNMNLRDPLLYRIRFAEHPMTGNKWCIYPLYDYTHGISDALEGITHSICTLEFEDHRPLYDWFLQELDWKSPPQQIEFAKLKLNYVVMSKRNLREMVETHVVSGWDDPRMPTIKGMRRRGFTPASLRNFCEQIGVTKSDSLIDMSVLEENLRQDLNETAPRRMAVLDPLKIVITNFSKSEEIILAANHPQKPELGQRQLPFSKELYIERDDFAENPPPKYFRLVPGGEVRLRNAYIIKCQQVVKNSNGEVTELHCTLDENTLGKNPEGRKVKGIIHWVSAKHAKTAEVRLYDRLFTVENPGAGGRDYKEYLNPESLKTIKSCYIEPSLDPAPAESSYQFERLGYFCVDSKDSKPNAMVFNRAVTLRDTWAKENKE